MTAVVFHIARRRMAGGSGEDTCRRHVDRAFEKSAAVRTLLAALERAGCPVNRTFFSCERCEQDCQGGYDRDRGVILCQQHMDNAALTESTMVHELIHAFDDCRARVNWMDLKHHACTEIRAANLSGDCSFGQEFARGNLNLRAQQQKCVRRRAELSVAMNPASSGTLMLLPARRRHSPACVAAATRLLTSAPNWLCAAARRRARGQAGCGRGLAPLLPRPRAV